MDDLFMFLISLVSFLGVLTVGAILSDFVIEPWLRRSRR